MEENKKTTKSKLRAYLPVIILGIAMVASAIGLGIAAFNKAQKANDTAKDIPFNTEFMTVEEIDQLEDYVDKLTAEEIEALKAEAKKGVKDELTLRLLLLLDDKIEIKVSNNMELIAGMKVNGTKTLTGDASLKMFLGSAKNTIEDAILIVTRGNSLDMDGLVLDGNGVCHAILVQEGATLNYNDGTIQYASSYGIYNQGTATVNGGTLTKCMAAAIGVKAGAKTYVTGGTIKDNYKNHIWAADNSVVEVTGGVFDHSYEHAIYNRGTLTMTGGTIKNSNSANACAVANFGKAYIDGGDDYIEISNCVTGFFSEDDNMEVNKVYGHDIGRNFLRIKDGKGKVTNCKIENTGTYAVRAGGEVTIENIYAENLGTHGIYISPGKVTVKNVEVKNAKEYGFVNVGGEATATDIKITGAGTSAFINYDSTFNGKGEKGLLTLKNCTATDCNSNLLVRGGTSVKVSDCTFNKTKRTNVHMTEGTAELTNVKLLGSTDADCSIVSIRKDAKATFKNVEMAHGNRGISLAGKITVNGGSIHDNKGELAGNAIRTEENAVYHLEGVKIYNNHNTSTKMAGGVGFMAKGSHGTIIDCEITDNTSIRTVGGIYAEEAELNIRNTVFKKNHTSGAEGKGGAILLEKSKSIIRGCTFEENSTESKYQNVGGAIYSKAGSDLTIKGCTFDSNKSGRGGAIANTGKLTIEADSETKKATIFKNNECTEGGAGVYNGGNGVVTDTGSTYEQNKLTEVHAGGAIRNDGANTQYKLVDATLKENSSKGDGGAIYSNGLVFVATRCTFDGNLAEQGGAAYINTTSAAKNPVEANGNGFALSATDCVFVNNKSIEKKENTLGGGALYFTGTGKAIVQNKNYESTEANKYDNAYFKGNHAEVEGGAIVVGGNVDLTLRGYKFAENTSNLNSAAIYVKGKLTDLNGYYYKNTVTNEKADTAKGGAIQCHLYQSLAEAKFTNTVFEENSTPGDGGAIYNNGKSVTLKDCKLLNNVARQGGAIYNKKAATFVNVAIDEAAYKGDAGSCVYVAKGGTLSLDNLAMSNIGTNKNSHAILNDGGKIVAASGAKKTVTIDKVAGHGIVNTNEGTVKLSNVAITDVTTENRDGIYVVSGEVAVTDAAIQNVARDGVYVKGGAVTIEDTTLGNIKRAAITATDTANESGKQTAVSNVTLKNVSVKLAEGAKEDARAAQHGIYCVRGNVNVDNVNISNTGSTKDDHAVLNDGGTIKSVEGASKTITIADTTGHGIANINEGTVNLSKVAITDVATEKRDGIYANSGKVEVTDAQIENVARGAIYSVGGTIIANNVTAKNASYGAYAEKTGVVSLNGATVDGAKVNGICNVSATVNVANVTLKNTSTDKDSHAVFNNGGTIQAVEGPSKTITIIGTTGHGIANTNGGTVKLHSVSLQNITRNGIHSTGGTVTVDGAIINGAADGVYLKHDSTEGTLTVKNATIEGVTRGLAVAKGKIIAETVTVQKTAAGKATDYGVLVHDAVSAVELKDVTVKDAAKAGVRAQSGGTVTANNVTITGGVVGVETEKGTVQKADDATIGIAVTEAQYGIKHTSGTATVKDVVVSNATTAGVHIVKGNLNTENITVSGGNKGITGDAGTIAKASNATGITITNTKYGIDNAKGSFTVKDINITGGNCAIYNRGGEITTENISIVQAKKGISNATGTVKVSNISMENIGTANDQHAVFNDGGTIKAVDGATETIAITGATGHGIANTNSGTVNLVGVSMQNIARNGINSNNGTVTVTDISIKSAIDGIYLNHASATGTITVTDATIEDVTRGIAIAKGKVIAEDVTVKKSLDADGKNPDYGVFVHGSNSTAELKNVSVENAVLGDVGVKNGGTINANNVAVAGGKAGVEAQGGTVQMSTGATTGVTVTGAEYGINNVSGDATVKNVAINNATTAGVCIEAGTLNTENVTVDGGSVGIETKGGTVQKVANASNGITVSNVTYGIKHASGTATVKNVAITNATAKGIYLNSVSGELTVEHVTIKGAGDGVYLKHSSADGKLTVKNATIEDVTRGIAIAQGKVVAENVTVQKSADTNGKNPESGVFVHGANSVAEVKSVIVKNATVAGINLQSNGTVIANNVTVNSCDLSVFTTNGTLQKADGATAAVTVIPANYVVDEEIVKGATGTESIVESISALVSIQQDSNSPDTTWFVNSAGKLGKTVSDAEAKIGDNQYATLQEALEVAAQTDGATVVLMKDATLSEPVEVTKNLTLTSDRAVIITRAGALVGQAGESLITVTSGKLSVVGTQGKEIVIDGNASTEKNECIRAIKVAEGAELHMEYATIQNFYTSNSFGEGGTAIYNEGTTTLAHVNLTNNQTGTSSAGGAVRNQKGTFTISDSTLSACSTNGSGGAIYAANGASTTITNCEFIQNTSGSEGGAIYFNGSSPFVINNCTFEDNTAVKGGAISVLSATINGASFAGNTASTAGNDVFLKTEAGNVTVSGAFVGATVAYSGDNAGIKIADQVTGDMTILPHSYTAGTQLVVKASDTVGDDVYASSLSAIKVDENNGDVWFLNNEGKLTKAVAVIGNAYYTDFASALAAANASSEATTIKLAADVSVNSKISVNKDLTFVSDKAVTISGTVNNGNLFEVVAGGKLTIKGASDSAKIIIAKDATKNVINNSGTVLLEYVNITGGAKGIYTSGGTIGTSENPLLSVKISGCSGHGIHSQNSGKININGLTIENPGQKGIAIQSSSATIKNVIITGTKNKDHAGIYIDGESSRVTMDYVTISNTKGVGLQHAGGELTITSVNSDGIGLKVENAGTSSVYITKGSITGEIKVVPKKYEAGQVIVSGTSGIATISELVDIQPENNSSVIWSVDSEGKLVKAN